MIEFTEQNELITQNEHLPATLEGLTRFILVGREQLNAVRAAIRAIDKVEFADEVRRQKLEEAQMLSEALLDAEVQVGKLMSQVPKATGKHENRGNQYTSGKRDSGVTFSKPDPWEMVEQAEAGILKDPPKTKKEVIEECGFNKKQISRFEQLAKYPEAVAQAKAEARENDDIVSRSAVLKKIKDKERLKKQETVIQQQIDKPKTSAHVDIYTTDNKYRVIYADPPWSYNDKQNTDKLGGAEKHYPTMSIQELCDLPIPAEDNAVLFLWVTSPLLEDCFKVINAWGFTYKSSFVWDKIKHNMGHYNSVRHELLLVCTKGSCTPDVQKLFDSVVSVERTDHSRKPQVFREMIDTLYPVGDRIELFAREAPEGWDVWGNMA